jgi:hypothetical protein
MAKPTYYCSWPVSIKKPEALEDHEAMALSAFTLLVTKVHLLFVRSCQIVSHVVSYVLREIITI